MGKYKHERLLALAGGRLCACGIACRAVGLWWDSDTVPRSAIPSGRSNNGMEHHHEHKKSTNRPALSFVVGGFGDAAGTGGRAYLGSDGIVPEQLRDDKRVSTIPTKLWRQRVVLSMRAGSERHAVRQFRDYRRRKRALSRL